jgi:hypothetical protein
MQTSYDINMGAGIAGQLADLRDNVVESFVADVKVQFGIGVVQGAKANSCKIPTAGGQTYLGVALQQHTEQSYPFTAASGSYAANDVVNVCRRGLVRVQTAGAVTNGNTAYIVATGGDGVAGLFIDSSASSAIAAGTFRETTTAAGTALVELNLP